MPSRRQIIASTGVVGLVGSVLLLSNGNDKTPNSSDPVDNADTRKSESDNSKNIETPDEMESVETRNNQNQKELQDNMDKNTNMEENNIKSPDETFKLVLNTDIPELTEDRLNETMVENEEYNETKSINELIRSYTSTEPLEKYDISIVSRNNASIVVESKPSNVFSALREEREIESISKADESLSIRQFDSDNRTEEKAMLILNKEKPSYGIKEQVQQILQQVENNNKSPQDAQKQIQNLREEYIKNVKQDVENKTNTKSDTINIENMSIGQNPIIQLRTTQVTLLNLLDLDAIEAVTLT